MASKSKVYFFSDKVIAPLSNRQALKKYIELIFRKEGKKLGYVNYVFCTDARLLQINRNYLEHNYYTDIITFDLLEPGSLIRGEIYISIERVRENAKKLDIPIKIELHRVIFHGVLHLCGYMDKNKEEKRKMREKENFYLSTYFD